MHQGRIVFSPLMAWLPMHKFSHCIDNYEGSKDVRILHMSLSVYVHGLAFVIWNAVYGPCEGKFTIFGIRGKVSRNTLAETSEKRDWRIYSYFAQILIHEARQSYADNDFRLELQEAVYALDATFIYLCLFVFPRVWFRKTKKAIRLHALLDQEATPPLLYG
jgi:hypothetical protein